MRMIQMVTNIGNRLINPDQITNIWQDTDGTVKINLSCGAILRTKFTTIDHALDYVQRASSHSLVGG
mgnify:CR=1 FL=1